MEEQEIWSWGAGTDGQLGTGRVEDETLPQLLRTPSLPSGAAVISSVSCGGAHVIALTASGGVVTWGRGNSGQLGHGDMASSLHPKPVMGLESYFITHVSAGWTHSGFVSEEGRVYTCGDGSFGQLGHGDSQSRCFPHQVLFFSDKHVAQIACGMRHSIVLLKGCGGGQVYGFGAGKRGQLGISKKVQSVNLPILCSELETDEIVGIAAGGDHSAALTNDGRLFTWGRGFKTKSNDVYCPRHLPSPSFFTKVALGWNHALLLTDDGELYMLGGKYHGALSDSEKLKAIKSLPGDSDEDDLRVVPALSGIKVLDIAAGAEHSVIVTEKGSIETWGWGEHGQLGLGDTCDHTNPQTVNLNHQLDRANLDIKVYCGSGFTVAVSTPYAPARLTSSSF